jgi:UDP-N-acetylmuramoyl-L-alanyl-D-glutamate--2,6-diaminopimelate ligase
MLATQVLSGLHPMRIQGDPSIDISSIEFDSRLTTPGSMFVALRGGYIDGHTFLPMARANGAVAAIVEPDTSPSLVAGYALVVEINGTRAALAVLAANFFANPSRDLTVIGVTGTDGKTTTSHFIEAICRSTGTRTGLIGTVEVRIGPDEDLHESRQTTPESLLVQHYLAQMRDAGVTTAVIEATSHGLELHRLDGVEFDIGVVTNVTREHLDFHGTVEQYRIAKGGLFRRVNAAKQFGKRGIAIVNLDDEGATSLERFAGDATIIRYSAAGHPAADVQAAAIRTDSRGADFRLTTRSDSTAVRIHLPGAYNVANALAAASAGVALGLEPEAIARGLASLQSVPGRMESVDEGQPFAVIVDYAHTPEAIRSVLSEARRLTRTKLLIVFGSAGERDVGKRSEQGAIAVTAADFAVFTSEDPRFEDPDAIIADIAAGAREAGGRAGVDFECIEDRRRAIGRALERATAGDVVILAGKGHERSMIYGSDKRPWHEANVARELLHSLGYRSTASSESED